MVVCQKCQKMPAPCDTYNRSRTGEVARVGLRAKVWDNSHMLLRIHDHLVPFILFQRTEYLFVQNSTFLNSLLIRIPFLSYNTYVGLEARFRRGSVKRKFSDDMEREYGRIKSYLPERVTHILDIGSGIAGVDALIDRHYARQEPRPQFHLLDKTQVAERVYYGFEEKAAFYNSLEGARLFLESNGVDPSRIHTAEVGDANRIPFGKVQFDLIVSLISWGFHYPIAAYLDEAYARLAPGGTLIIDVRRGSNGEAELRERFSSAEMICAARKYDRFVARKA